MISVTTQLTAMAVRAPTRIRHCRETKIQSSSTSPNGKNKCGFSVHSQSAAPAQNGRVR